jgi:hypothetical protein
MTPEQPGYADEAEIRVVVERRFYRQLLTLG